MGGRASVAPQMVLVVQVDNTGLLVIVIVLVIAGCLSKLSRTKTLGSHKNRLKP